MASYGLTRVDVIVLPDMATKTKSFLLEATEEQVVKCSMVGYFCSLSFGSDGLV